MQIPKHLSNFLESLNKTFLFNGGLQFYSNKKITESLNGKNVFQKNYDTITKNDILFAHDYFGDQFFLRNEMVIKLYAETGEVENYNLSIDEWWQLVEQNPEETINIDLSMSIKEGNLFLAYPPFCFEESNNIEIKDISEKEVIEFHIDLYNKIKNLRDGEKIKFIVE